MITTAAATITPIDANPPRALDSELKSKLNNDIDYKVNY
jgi:hypothetical protein